MKKMDFPFYKRCGRCGCRNDRTGGYFVCSVCKKKTFINPHLATAVIFHNECGETLFVRRAIDPEKGMLDFPGGFVEIGESIEEAASREMREELGIAVNTLTYFCSVSDEYPYEGEVFPITGIFFLASLLKSQKIIPQDDVDQIIWRKLEEVDINTLAFRSLRQIVQRMIGENREKSRLERI